MKYTKDQIIKAVDETWEEEIGDWDKEGFGLLIRGIVEEAFDRLSSGNIENGHSHLRAVKVKDRKGWFHGWGERRRRKIKPGHSRALQASVAVEFVKETVAIIELEDGSVTYEEPHHITFLNVKK